jgi:hypothetical protein
MEEIGFGLPGFDWRNTGFACLEGHGMAEVDFGLRRLVSPTLRYVT